MKKVLKVIGIALLVIILLIAALLFWLSKQPSVPDNYTKTVKTGGEIEAEYMAMGSHAVSCFESTCLNSFRKAITSRWIAYPRSAKNAGTVFVFCLTALPGMEI